MQKNELMKSGNSVIRVLQIKGDGVLVVDCMRKAMPLWMTRSELSVYEHCKEQDLNALTGTDIKAYDDLDQESRKFAQEHYALIAGILPYIGDDRLRCSAINIIAEERSTSKQTLRNYLWRYLVYQDIAALAPKQRKGDRPLTQDEKNMRWALNKFFYTRHKNSLNTAYMLMLKEKYCSSSGELADEYPSIHQFRYFYRKYNKQQTYYISREGIKKYQRDYRPLLGDGVQEFAPSIGTGMLDATICDVYLVNDAGHLVGRPILTACVDAYSGLCCGYSLTWEGGIYSLRELMTNIIADKVKWCKQFGISIKREDWDCSQLPYRFVTDMGSEYKSANLEQLAELGVTIVNLPSFRPELKGKVEKFFDLIQSSYKKHLKGRGVIEPDYRERGAKDYRKEACLTLQDFEKIVLHCIIFYNHRRIVNHFPFSPEMIAQNIKPYASDIWNWGKKQAKDNLIRVSRDELVKTLLPRTVGKFTRYGLKVNGMRYKNDGFIERFLQGGTATVAYNPDDVMTVWLVESCIYTEFTLAESRFSGFNLEDAKTIKASQNCWENSQKRHSLQAQIDLAGHITAIADSAVRHGDVDMKQIRETRNMERNRNHIDFLKDEEKQ